jgi:hypothetical protein
MGSQVSQNPEGTMTRFYDVWALIIQNKMREVSVRSDHGGTGALGRGQNAGNV